MALPTLTPPPTAPSRSDAPATFIARADAFIAWFATNGTEMQALGAAIVDQSATSNFGSSTTSLLIGTGSKSLTIQTGKGFQVGQFVMVANTVTPANYMLGQITSYNNATGALVVNVASVGGTGTFAAWTVSLAPATGGLQTTGGTMGGLLTTAASAAGSAGFNMPHGVAPTSPNNGDIWTTSTALFYRINGVTRQSGTLDAVETLTNKTLTTATLSSPTITGTATVAALTASGLIITTGSASGGAGFRLTPGAAPTSPIDGDLWGTTGGVFARVNGTTRQFGTIDGTETLANKTLTSPTLNTPTINTPTITDAAVGSTIKDAANVSRNIGFRGIPPRAAASSQVLAIADNGTEIEITTGGVTVPQNSSVALPADFVCVIFNNSGVAQTITQGTGVTLRLLGTATTGNRTLGAYGSCTIRASATANLFKISGAGVS